MENQEKRKLRSEEDFRRATAEILKLLEGQTFWVADTILEYAKRAVRECAIIQAPPPVQ